VSASGSLRGLSSSCVCTTVPCPVAGDNYLTEGGGAVGDYFYVLTTASIPVVSKASVTITVADLDKGTDTTDCTQTYSRNMDDDGVKDCDAGHILANRLGGLGNEPINIFPQNSSVNRGIYAQFEDQIYDCVYGGAQASLSWVFKYQNTSSTKPNQVVYNVALKGGSCGSGFSETFPN